MAKAQAKVGRRDLEEARARSADQVAGRTGHARLDRREGDRQGRRAPARRRRVRQSSAETHEAAVGSDDRLRARVRQGHARPSDHQGRTRSADALQHLQYRRLAAGADLQSRQGGARGGRESRCGRRSSISSPTEPAATRSRRRWTSTSRTSRIGGKIEQDAKDRLAPDAAPTPAPTPTPAKHGALDDVDPAIFGAVALGDAPVDSGPLAARLGKLAENRKATGALLGPGGALSTTRAAGASLDALGAIITGVNDEPPAQAFPDDPGPDDAAQPVASVPLSAAALADQKARIARYVDAGAPPIRASPGSTRPPARRRGRAPSTPPKARRSIRCATRPTTSITPTRCRPSTPIEARRSRPRSALTHLLDEGEQERAEPTGCSCWIQ